MSFASAIPTTAPHFEQWIASTLPLNPFGVIGLDENDLWLHFGQLGLAIFFSISLDMIKLRTGLFTDFSPYTLVRRVRGDLKISPILNSELKPLVATYCHCSNLPLGVRTRSRFCRSVAQSRCPDHAARTL